MGRLAPCKDSLPVAQQCLWPKLRQVSDLGFVLYGGTAIALRLGHRSSVDFDFFSEKPLNRPVIQAAFSWVTRSTTWQDYDNTWVLRVPCDNAGQDHVKVSFFGQALIGRVGEPDMTEDGVMPIASLDDLMATKVKVVLQRAQAKDYADVAAMIQAGVSLSRGLASARLLFGINFQPSESLKALVYFNDGDLNRLTAADKHTLIEAVKTVRDLPDVRLQATYLGGEK